MKKVVLLISLFLCFQLCKSQYYAGFMGFTYDMTMDEASDFIVKNVKFSGIEMKENSIKIEDVTFAGIKFDFLLIKFYKDQLCSGFFRKNYTEFVDKKIDCFNLSKMLIEKYEEPDVKTSQVYIWKSDLLNRSLNVLGLNIDDPSDLHLVIYYKDNLKNEMINNKALEDL